MRDVRFHNFTTSPIHGLQTGPSRETSWKINEIPLSFVLTYQNLYQTQLKRIANRFRCIHPIRSTKQALALERIEFLQKLMIRERVIYISKINLVNQEFPEIAEATFQSMFAGIQFLELHLDHRLVPKGGSF